MFILLGVTKVTPHLKKNKKFQKKQQEEEYPSKAHCSIAICITRSIQ